MGTLAPQFEVIGAAGPPACADGGASRPATGPHGSDAAAGDEGFAFYVEFRVVQNGVYGHSYVAHGRLDENNSPATAHYADIHPNGGFFSMVVGHLIPMTATTDPVEETIRREIISVYPRTLCAAEYQALIAVIASRRAAAPSWSVFRYNCNDFVAEVARAIGLRTPPTLMRPYRFIPELRRLNEPARIRSPAHAAPPALRHAASAR